MGRTAPHYARPFVSPLLAFAAVLVLWLAFGVMLAARPDGLRELWDIIQDLWLPIRVVVWLAFLPWVLGLWAWQADWSIWLRLAAVLSLAVATAVTFFPRTAER